MRYKVLLRKQDPNSLDFIDERLYARITFVRAMNCYELNAVLQPELLFEYCTWDMITNQWAGKRDTNGELIADRLKAEYDLIDVELTFI